MAYKAVIFLFGCALAWFVLLPVLVVGGGLFLLAWAVLTEVGELLVGQAQPLDNKTARESARRVCLGH